MISGKSCRIAAPIPSDQPRRDTGPRIPSWTEQAPGNIPAQHFNQSPSYEGDLLRRELAAQREIEYKKTCVAPLHKSNYVYVTEGMDPRGFGRKNEIL